MTSRSIDPDDAIVVGERPILAAGTFAPGPAPLHRIRITHQRTRPDAPTECVSGFFTLRRYLIVFRRDGGVERTVCESETIPESVV